MWISRRDRPDVKREALAEDGQVTIEDRVGVYAEGERRNLTVYGPGGYFWRPGVGQQVLVLKLGQQGEQPCVAGAELAETEWTPGEVMLYSDGASITLRNNGRVEIRGKVHISGDLYVNGEKYPPCRN